MRLSIIQMGVDHSKQQNLATAFSLVGEACPCEIVVLPEMFNCPYNIDIFPDYAESYPDGETIQFLARTATHYGIYLIGGSIPEFSDGRLYNTCFVFDPQGQLVCRYRKMHLFDVHIPGGLTVQESRSLTPGTELVCFSAAGLSVGLAICFDLRFPEQMLALAGRGAEIIVVPAVFNAKTGAAHWRSLLRVRAMDNQVYMVGAAAARGENAEYVAYGHSMIVDPWGDVIAETDQHQSIISATIDRQRIRTIRAQFPLLQPDRF